MFSAAEIKEKAKKTGFDACAWRKLVASPDTLRQRVTLALTPRPLGWYGDDPEEDFRRQCAYSPWTSMVNVAGLPAITLPVGVTADDHPDGGGLPMGVQLIGRPGGERTLLALGAQLERRLRWQRRHPPMW